MMDVHDLTRRFGRPEAGEGREPRVADPAILNTIDRMVE